MTKSRNETSRNEQHSNWTKSEFGNTQKSDAEVWNQEALKRVAHESHELSKMQEQVISKAKRMEDFPFVGQSPEMQKVFELLNKVADSDTTVLILGESGTGKELVARSLHQRSIRRAKPFVPVNCGAIPSELLESELFGHVKGAFTGAHQSRVGRFSLAHQGTLFLDEIGTMPVSLQVKLLRALQEKEFEPVGGMKTIGSDCRVVAATNIDLEQEVMNGSFREDLYYRLNVIPIHLPALRERRDDIPLLVEHFIRKLNETKGYKIEGVSKEAMNIFMQYNWPGNVREIENICQRLCVIKGEGLIDVEDLPPKIQQPRAIKGSNMPWAHWMSEGIPDEGLPLDDYVQQFENELILKALEKTRWNKNKAAQLLKMNRTTLVEKIKKRGLQPPQ